MDNLPTKIIHVDMDAFYVSVETRDNPKLAERPIAVGGKAEQRGVIATCNYIARRFGVHSAMSSRLAMQKCPQLLIIPPRMSVYKEASQIIRGIFNQYTDLVEPLSLDEAYLEVSASEKYQGSATRLASEIRQNIYRKTELTASAGVAPIKFVAKIASDINKPNGQFTVSPVELLPFIAQLELAKIPGVGKVTQTKLKHLGLQYGKDVQNSDESILVQHFGKFGRVLWQRCHGIDKRQVEVSRERKSVGVERTFSQDFTRLKDLEEYLLSQLFPELQKRAEPYVKNGKINKLGVKIKFNDFTQTTKEQKFDAIDSNLLLTLLCEGWKRGNKKPVRLLGIHIGLKQQDKLFEQLELNLP